jgi:RNA polymerase primary sigma factor
MKAETRPRPGLVPGFQTYVRDIAETALLSAREERDLADRIAAGDPSARDHLVRANLRLVVNIARGYLGRGLPPEDLIAEGNLGLLRAVEGFDGAFEIRFSTYASYWIKQSIRRGVMNQGELLRMPAYLVSLMARWRRATAVLTGRLGREPVPEEVGEALGLSRKRSDIVARAILVERMMNSPEPGIEDECALDRVADERSRKAADRMFESDALDRILRGLDRLDERKATVIRMRFGLGTSDPLTLNAVGRRLGLTRERIRQLEKEALQELADATSCERSSDPRPPCIATP